VLFSGGDWLLLAAVTPIAWVLARRFPLRGETLVRTVLAHAAGALALCVGWASLGMLVGMLLHHYPAQGDNIRGNYVSWILTTLPFSAIVYFAVLGAAYGVTFFLEARRRQAQEARLAAQLAEARLGALRMQLNPHFLFNSLNAIAVLVRDQRNADAARVIELLGGVLHQVLQGDKRQEVTLDEELRFLEQYLAIEQVRFSDRLLVRWSVPTGLRGTLVPEFILQPLVENAVRHGVARRSAAGTIEISAQVEGDDLVLSVQDDGPGMRPDEGGNGVGLANARERLETLFGERGRVEVGAAAGGGTVASVRFPLRRGSHA
jgi:two-component system, LytTR family, sensor kinase